MFCMFFPQQFMQIPTITHQTMTRMTDLMEETPQTQTSTLSDPTMVPLLLLCEVSGGVVALREGLNGSSLSLWESTSIHTSPCWIMHSCAQVLKNLRTLGMHLQLTMRNNNNSGPVDDLLPAVFQFLVLFSSFEKEKKQTLLFFSQRFYKNSAHPRFIR